MGNKTVEKLHGFFSIFGGLVNGLIVFLNTALGNIGKLLSTAVILFTMYLIWRAFQGQIENIIPFPDMSKVSGDELAKALELRRMVYKGAIESVSAPLATLCGAVVSVIGIGITVQKFIDKNKNGVDDRQETQTQPPVVAPVDPTQNTEVKY
jgi:hypothetical protein